MVMYPETDVIQVFYDLCKEADRALDQTNKYPEDEFDRVIDHVTRHPERRNELAAAFLKVLGEPYFVDPELVEYCMHVLRWPEVKNAAEARMLVEKDLRARPGLGRVIHSFSDDWDTDGYRRWKVDN
jgi:hypothetical protein